MSHFADLQLDKLSSQGLLRSLVPKPVGTSELRDFASNDYLALAEDPRVKEAAIRVVMASGCSASASALMSGRLPIHGELENALAALTGREEALVFGSGYLNNLGVLGALCDRQDNIFTDKLNHASLVDGARLTRAKVFRYQHNDMDNLELLLRRAPGSGKRIIVTESIFSMDGDIAPLQDLLLLAKNYGALLVVDEAHAIGVFGGGLMKGFAPRDDSIVILGTLSKSLGSYGGFTACGSTIKKLLVNQARTFIYSTALPPPSAGAALEAVRIVEAEPNRGYETLENARLFSRLLHSDTEPCPSQIVPFLLGNNERALSSSEKLREKAILAPAIRPPTVPAGTARLRFSITHAHSPQMLREAASEILSVIDNV